MIFFIQLPILLLFILTTNLLHADDFPDIYGKYSGSCTAIVSNCSAPGDNGTSDASSLKLTILTDAENTFSGSGTCTYTLNGFYIGTEYLQFSGSVTESGQLNGISTHTFSDGSSGEGTFTGQLDGDTLTIDNPGQDTFGDTCTYTRTMSATRTTSAKFSIDHVSGIPPLSVTFTDESKGTITSWSWDFGDGSTSNLQHPTHMYTNEGKYTIKLTVSGPSGTDYIVKTDYLYITGNIARSELKLLPSDGAKSDLFGFKHVSISGNYSIIGAPYDNDKGRESGSAYIFERNRAGWDQVAKLNANDGTAYVHFGESVAISGDYAIIGTPRDYENGSNCGAAYIFERSENNWNQVVKLTPDISSNPYQFGTSVSIAGNFAIVGNTGGGGAVYIFERINGSWNQVAKLTASDGVSGDWFGQSVAISGDYAIVGAYNYSSIGSAYVFQRNDTGWSQVAKLNASDGVGWERFGWSVSIFSDYIIIGAPLDDSTGEDSGSVYIFERRDNSWSQVSKITASDGAYRDWFGQSVSIAGKYAIVGAPADDDNGSESGSSYIFKRSDNGWSQVAKITASDGNESHRFGYGVSIFGDNALVSAYGDDDNGVGSGSAYIFNLPIKELSNAKSMPWLQLLLE